MNLHVHSYYSKLDGAASVESLVAKAAGFEDKFICLTDHGNIGGWYDLASACKKNKVKPGFGVEGYLSFGGVEGGEGNEGIPHITLIAKNKTGFNNIAKLMKKASRSIDASTEEVHEKYGKVYFNDKGLKEELNKYSHRRRGRPVFTFEDLEECAEGLIVTTGCPTGVPTRLIVKNNLNITKEEWYKEDVTSGIRAAYAFCERVKALQARGATPVVEIVAQPAISAPFFYAGEIAWEYLVAFSKRLGIPYVLTSDAHFLSKEDYPAQDLLLRIGTNNPYSEEKKIPIPDYQFLCSAQGLINRAIRMGMSETQAKDGIENAKALNDIIEEVEIDSGSYPKFLSVTGSTDPVVLLRKQATRGVGTPERKARLEHELEVIAAKGIADYFLILNSCVQYIKQQGHIVVCRGSAGGCLLSYAIGLSETDPIEHDLLFERFLDKDRDSPPDIDIDMSPEARKKAVKYLSSRYNTCKVLSLNMLTRKSAIIDAARMFGIKREELESALSACNDDLDDEVELDHLPQQIQDLYNRYPKLATVEKIVHTPRNESKNAAGLIVSSEPIPIPIIFDADGEEISTVDKKKLDKLGLMKADLLSVRVMSVIEGVLSRIGQAPDWLYKQDIYDERVHNHALLYPAGIFQLDGSVLPVLKKIRYKGCNPFEMFYTASALARPGSMNYVPKFCERKTTGNPILDRTFGVVVFQEQIMELARIGGGDPQKLRAAVSKSEAAQVAKMMLEWNNLGLSAELVQNVISHGKYSFNKSHCVTYALVGFWMAYLKYYYPEIFVEEYIKCELADGNDTDWILIRRLLAELQEQRPRSITPFDQHVKTVRITHDKITGGLAFTGSTARSYLQQVLDDGSKRFTPAKQAEFYRLMEYAAKYTSKKVDDWHEMLTLYPWVPVHGGQVPPSMHFTGEMIAGYVTRTERLPQTKAMPYAIAEFLIESEDGVVYGRVSSKEYALYNKILNMQRGKLITAEVSGPSTRVRLHSLK